MPSTLTAPDPAVFSEAVRRFAAERGVTDYLVPLYELAKQCFDGADVTLTREDDPDIPDLSWIAIEVAVGEWDVERIEASYGRWTPAFVRLCPGDVSAAFALGMR
jgi:hypothetical protein